jgi:hypothetical protein
MKIKLLFEWRIWEAIATFQGQQWQDKICAHLQHINGDFMNYKFEVVPSKSLQKTPKKISSKFFLQTMNFGDGR